MQNENKTSPFVWVLLFSCVLIWGSSYILIKRGLLAFSPLQVGALRLTVAAVCMLPFAVYLFRTRKKDYPWRDVALAAVFGNLVPAICYPLAQQKLASGTVGVLNAFTPLLTLAVGYLFFSTRVKWWNAVGVGLGLIGAITLVMQKSSGGESHYLYGIPVFIATLCYGINVNFVKRRLSDIGSMELASFSLAFAGIPAALYLFLGSDFTTIAATPDGLTAVGYVFILGAFGTALASVLFYKMLNLTGPLFASSTTYLMPIVSLAWGFLDQEAIGWAHILGMALILGGVSLVNKK